MEVLTFSLVPSADEAAFLAADEAYQAALMAGAEGFVRRTTAKGTGDAAGRWAAVTLWWGAAWADAAPVDGAAARAVDAFVDAATRVVQRFETLD